MLKSSKPVSGRLKRVLWIKLPDLNLQVSWSLTQQHDRKLAAWHNRRKTRLAPDERQPRGRRRGPPPSPRSGRRTTSPTCTRSPPPSPSRCAWASDSTRPSSTVTSASSEEEEEEEYEEEKRTQRGLTWTKWCSLIPPLLEPRSLRLRMFLSPLRSQRELVFFLNEATRPPSL